jgi:L-asparaginase
MTIQLKAGSFRTADFNGRHQALTLFHGGAGPADPKADLAILARNALCVVAEELKDVSVRNVKLSSFLTGEHAVTAEAEAIGLAGVRLLELDPLFNAGYGAALQEDGIVRVSASFMESRRRKFSAVMNATEILHPSELAFYLQRRRFCVLDAQGSAHLARELAIPRAELVTAKRFERWLEYRRKRLTGVSGTVGVVSVTVGGELAAVASTGGVGNETVGRVGDTPTVAGNFCTDRVAISCTGTGEEIIAHALSPRIAIRFEEACRFRMRWERAWRKQ